MWNQIAGRDPDAGVLDRDLFYFDDRDLSWEAEDRVIRRVAVMFADTMAGSMGQVGCAGDIEPWPDGAP